jgi:hypothetical protein
MYIVGRAVEWINDPRQPIRGVQVRRRFRSSLLTYKSMIREPFMEKGFDGVLCRQVGISDEVKPPLLAHGEALPPLFQYRPRPAGRFTGDLHVFPKRFDLHLTSAKAAWERFYSLTLSRSHA